jgi:translation initiation factor IF-2
MSEIKKPVRLSKVARELNVGISTIVDFLSDNGHEVESNPNSKLTGDMYGALLKEFAADQTVKAEANSVGISTREERETISITASAATKEDPPMVVVVPEVVEEKPEPIPAPVPAPTPVPAPVAETPAPTPPVVEVPVVAEPTPPVVEPVAEVKEAAPAPDGTIRAKPAEGMKVSIVGKIDLDTKADKARGKGKAAKPVAKAPVAAAPKVEAPKAAPAKPVAPVAVKAPEAPVVPAKPKEPEMIKAQARKLAGPTVVGKIVLPEKRQKPKPVASSSDPQGGSKKRKRRRITPVDVAKTTGGNAGRGGVVARKPAGKPAKGRKPEVTEKDIQKEIKETLARLSGGGKNKAAKQRRAKRDDAGRRREADAMADEMGKSVLKLTEFVTVSQLGSMMDVGVNEVIGACMSLGIFASINQRLDAETLSVIAEDFGFSVDFVSADVQETIVEEEDNPEALIERPPIVTVMGHVDHGKTSLLDYIRKANVIAGEAGGITQHIGSYKVTLPNGKEVAFLDTPGHEAFTAMRARGAQATDLAIIVISADDNVMPQTKEAINHAQAAGVPMIFAFNKIDKDGADPERIKSELANMNILVEDWGGKYQSQDISAKKGTNIEQLLEKVLLEAELLELKADPTKRAVGTIIESSLDKGRGYVCNMLVQGGCMKVGDILLAGCHYGRVKAMQNERGQIIESAGPATPVTVLGLNGAPSAGDRFNVLTDEKEAKTIAVKRLQLQREQGIRTQRHLTLDEIGRRIAIGDFQELNLIVKGDVDGSIEALSDSLEKMSTESIQVNIIHKGVGQITESDILLATASDAIVIGFQVRPSAGARKLAEKEQIDIRLYSIIYQAIDELKSAMEGMLKPEIKEEIIGVAEIREVFKISKVGTIAGGYVVEGKISRNSRIRVIRDGIVIFTGGLGSLKRFKDDVKEVTHGYECGLNVEKFNDIKEGDNIEAFAEVEVKKTL